VRRSASTGQFVFQSDEAESVGSVLYEEHLKLTSKSRMSPFAGYIMPLWYSSIAAEHEAVRQRAGLFDCTHMGVLEVSGDEAMGFLNMLATNNVEKLAVGRAQYSSILDAAGTVLDDIIIYRLAETTYMVVVNAANEPKIKAYIEGLLDGSVIVDANDLSRKVGFAPTVRDLRDASVGDDARVDLALQGPASIEILAKLTDDATLAEKLTEMKGFALLESTLAGIDCLICRTGYTGSKVGFELFVHPDRAAQMWQAVLEAGALPCGLGARDSLRVEAGLPLYGHELAGPFDISPIEAGYPWAVKLDKEFFIGKAAMEEVAQSYENQIVRLELPAAKGVRPVRQDDPILDEEGQCVGWILSSAKAQDKQYALAYVDRKVAEEGRALGAYYLARSPRQVEQGRLERLEKGHKAEADLTATVVSRFARF